MILTGIAAYFQWAFAGAQQQAVARAFGSFPLPPLTAFFFRYRIVFLLAPLPWVAFAIYASRGTASLRQLVTFSSTLVFVVLTLFIVAAVAFSLPWFPRHVISGNSSMHLNDEQRSQVLFAAERGDAEANYRLFLHYAFTTRQTELADKYLAKAAALGFPKAQSYVELRASNAADK
jgi:hypothetical protein